MADYFDLNAVRLEDDGLNDDGLGVRTGGDGSDDNGSTAIARSSRESKESKRARRRVKDKKAKRSEGQESKATKRKKMRESKGKAKPPREKVPPSDHIYKLPAEIRNQIYGYVLKAQTFRSTKISKKLSEEKRKLKKWQQQKRLRRGLDNRKVKGIRNGDDREPALLRVCPQIRGEAIGIYYALNSFKLIVSIRQLGSVERWISSARKRFDRPSSSAFRALSLRLEDFDYYQVGMLLPLANIVRRHAEYFSINQVSVHFKKAYGFTCIAKEVAQLGQKAALKGWGEEWLGLKFEEWLAQKAATESTSGYRGVGLRISAGMGGDNYTTIEPMDGDFVMRGFTQRNHASTFGTSDRKLRSSK